MSRDRALQGLCIAAVVFPCVVLFILYLAGLAK